VESYTDIYESNDIYGVRPLDASKGIMNNWNNIDISKDKDSKEVDGNSIDYSESFNYKKLKLKENINIISNLIDEYKNNYSFIGIRSVNEIMKGNEISNRWELGEPTDESLGGISTIEIYNEYREINDKSLKIRLDYIKKYNKRLFYIIGSEQRDEGEDDYESVLKDYDILAQVNKEFKLVKRFIKPIIKQKIPDNERHIGKFIFKIGTKTNKGIIKNFEDKNFVLMDNGKIENINLIVPKG
jgi:hypothetical protein